MKVRLRPAERPNVHPVAARALAYFDGLFPEDRPRPAVVGRPVRRYGDAIDRKAHGTTYTPERLATFVAERMLAVVDMKAQRAISILDPAVGDGALVRALLKTLGGTGTTNISIRGFDTDAVALAEAARRIEEDFPGVALDLSCGNFLDFAIDAGCGSATGLPLANPVTPEFDLIIANPPYVRTQVMGADRTQQLAAAFGLAGRVDLYQAFLLAMAHVLAPGGTAGMIVSNRFMTTKGAGPLRSALRAQFKLREVWDFGDTKLFDAAVLPAVLIGRGRSAPTASAIGFTSIYESRDDPERKVPDMFAALSEDGVAAVSDGRLFRVRRGTLHATDRADDIWRLTSASGDEWLATVERYCWKQFGDVGKIRVGVKTCADKVFIRHDWNTGSNSAKPELLRPLTTHHSAGRFRACLPDHARSILYPHECVDGRRRAVSLDAYPNSRAYLEQHRATLEARSYVTEAGRAWYEIWVPQNPQAWSAPKLVFRDISERPSFWMDFTGSVVNGDCYWLTLGTGDTTDLLWLAAAVANSRFGEAFYDHKFNNKLYAGRRRFITQYVEQFPLPDPSRPISREIVVRARAIYDASPNSNVEEMERELDALVSEAFGLSAEKIGRERNLELGI